MKRLFVGAMVAALAGAPGVSRAETPSAPREVAAPAPPYYLARPAPDDAAQSRDEASEYAARENAAPQLAEYAGGADGVYIGAGALAAILIVVLLVAVL